MAKPKKNKQPEGSCPYCWQHHDDEDVYNMHVSVEPQVIFIGPPLENYSRLAQSTFRNVLVRAGITDYTYIPYRRCNTPVPITTKEWARLRESWFSPLLEQLPQAPLIVLGGEAARLVVGGNPSDTSMANKTTIINGSLAAFTYSLKHWEVEECDQQILDHIIVTTKATQVGSPPLPRIVVDKLPDKLGDCVLDIETTGTEFPWYGSKLIYLGLKPLHEDVIYQLSADMLGDFKVQKRLADEVTKVIGHNLTFDLTHLRYLHVIFPNAEIHDTLIFQKNLDADARFNGLKYLAKAKLGFPHWETWVQYRMLTEELTTVFLSDAGRKYNAYDLVATEQLYKKQLTASGAAKIRAQFTLEMDYMPYVIKLIGNGMKVDTQALDELQRRTEEELRPIVQQFREEYALGEDFNFNSPQQVLHFLQHYVADVPDTSEATLQEYQDDHPVIKKLFQIRSLAKLVGTSIEGLRVYLDANALVHTTLQVHGAETGRSTSSSPNLQNTDPRVRSCFVSRFPTGKLIHTDLSGIEYRIIAHLSADRKLVRLFQNGEDIHSDAYLRVFGQPPADKVERKKGKTINFAGVYGCGINKFQMLTGLEGEELHDKFDLTSTLYPGVSDWKASELKRLREFGYVRNLFGRIRYFSGKIGKNEEREAINWIVQSTGHDVLKLYCMESYDRLRKRGCMCTLLISEVHDSITFDAPPEEADKVFKIISELAADLNPLIEHCFNVRMRIPIIAEVLKLERWE